MSARERAREALSVGHRDPESILLTLERAGLRVVGEPEGYITARVHDDDERAVEPYEGYRSEPGMHRLHSSAADAADARRAAGGAPDFWPVLALYDVEESR